MPVLARALDVASGFENESAPLERAVKKIKLIEMEFSEINITLIWENSVAIIVKNTI